MARILKGRDSKVVTKQQGLGEFFFQMGEKFGDKVCQIDADLDKEELYRSVKCRATQIAIQMKSKGVKPGDVVLFCSKNNSDLIVIWMASLYLNAKVTSVDPSLSVRDCRHCISIVKPKYIVSEESSIKLIENCIEDTNIKIIVLGNSKKYLTLKDLLKTSADEETFRPEKVDDPQETAVIFFSSGTTGLPKGICLSHYTMLRHADLLLSGEYLKMDRYFLLTSFYWITAIIHIILQFYQGSIRVFAQNPSPLQVMQILEKYKITFTFMAPIYSYELMNIPNVEKYNTSSLYSFYMGGTSISATQLEKTRTLFKHTKVALGYGSTECCGYVSVFHFTHDENMYLKKGISSGRPFLGVQIKIVDVETRKLLEPMKKGEICIKCSTIMNGYYNQDSSDCYDEEGFIKTGDIGYYDEDDCLYVIDRIKEMFKYQSWHIVPSVIEQVIQEHPDVKEAVVFGMPDEINGDIPTACVVIKENKMVTVDKLHDFINQRVSDRQRLRGGLKIVESIPKTPSGKLQRRILKEKFFSL